MQLKSCISRENWPKIIEDQGFSFHVSKPIGLFRRRLKYWDETRLYEFEPEELREIKEATQAIHDISLEVVEGLVRKGDLKRLPLSDLACRLIEDSWKKKEPHIYGRLDLSYDSKSPPKLLEYNADTPTVLIETAKIQAQWLKSMPSEFSQFNQIDSLLTSRWKQMQIPSGSLIHFACYTKSEEDVSNTKYLMETAIAAGFTTKLISISEVCYNSDRCQFHDPQGYDIKYLFKLYPWEWMIEDEFSIHISSSQTQMIEPAWKLVLTNKAILPILWEYYPNHKNLLPASFHENDIPLPRIKKPIFGREGQNMHIQKIGGKKISTKGGYGKEGYIYQSYHEIPKFKSPSTKYLRNHRYAVIGSWIIGDCPAGIGIRDDKGPITSNYCTFVPHMCKVNWNT